MRKKSHLVSITTKEILNEKINRVVVLCMRVVNYSISFILGSMRNIVLFKLKVDIYNK